MAKAEYETLLNLGYQNMDFTGHWKLSDMFTKMSDIATLHASNIGLWNSNMLGDYGWIVSKIRIKILKPVSFENNVALKTWVGKGSRVIFPRYYQVHDEKGDVLAYGVGLWSLLDLKNRRIVMPMRMGMQYPEDLNLDEPCQLETNFSYDDVVFEKIAQRKVAYSDIDTNQHLNNARYIEWICDLIDPERFKTHYIDDISVYFKKETAPSIILDLEIANQDDHFIIRGKHLEDVHFIAEGTWKAY